MNTTTKAALAISAILSTVSLAPQAATVTIMAGQTQISGNVLINSDGSYGAGEVTSIVNTSLPQTTLYTFGNGGYITFDFSGVLVDNARVSSGNLLLDDHNGTLTFYNSASDIYLSLQSAANTAAAQALVTGNGTNSIWLQGSLPATTTTSFSGFQSGGGVLPGCNDTLDPLCYGSLTEGGALALVQDNTGFNFISPMSYTLSANNLSGPQAYWGWLGNAGNNVIGVSTVPEPTTLSLLGISLLGLGFMRRKAA